MRGTQVTKVRTIGVLSALALILVIGIMPAGGMSRKPPEPAYMPGRVLVKFKSHVAEDRINEILREQNCEILKKIDLIDVMVLNIQDTVSVIDKVDRFNNYPEVEYAEPDHKAQPLR